MDFASSKWTPSSRFDSFVLSYSVYWAHIFLLHWMPVPKGYTACTRIYLKEFVESAETPTTLLGHKHRKTRPLHQRGVPVFSQESGLVSDGFHVKTFFFWVLVHCAN